MKVGLEGLDIGGHELMETDAGSGSLIGVGGANALTGGTNAPTTQFTLLEAIDDLVKFEDDVGTIRDEQALLHSLQALGLEGLEFLEDGGKVDDDPGANEALASRIDEA